MSLRTSPPVPARLLAAAAAFAVSLVVPAPGRAQTGEIGVHDPVIMKQGGIYYVFATGAGIPILRSPDLRTWARAGRVFEALPAWIATTVPGVRGESLWAPDISFYNGKYHLYYSASTFGSQLSAIGLATNRTLDPASPEYRWEDQGVVVRSTPRVDTFNAIDPNLIMDENGEPWLAWGSFWGGIKLRKVDKATGRLSATDTTLISIASRSGTEATSNQGADRSIEGAFIVRRATTSGTAPAAGAPAPAAGPPPAGAPPGASAPARTQPQQPVPPAYYYLFVSFDRCCAGARSTYNIRVGRSEKVTGPYLDPAGRPMTEGGGMVVLSSHGRVRGPGHNAILIENDTSYYLVHHFYDGEDNFRSRLQIRPLTWVQDWPYAGDPIAPPPPGTPGPPRPGQD
ncbi:MAG: arabinan endo-1,5-alpha-L-arabinosidase [Gemmatimonadetes bacterium]|nr:arabinan endo-1,5-alpha-L-arabinosidase [Gemmatimonadota bacterium]